MPLENTVPIRCAKCGHVFMGPRALLARKKCPNCGYDGEIRKSRQ